MKQLIIMSLMTLTGAIVNAGEPTCETYFAYEGKELDWPFAMPRDDFGKKCVAQFDDPLGLANCPSESTEDLVVSNFIHNADSKSTQGICFVTVNSYLWWDLIDSKDVPHPINVETKCDSKQFVRIDNKIQIPGTVSYTAKISNCGSTLGCRYECNPQVSTLWF